MTVVMANRTCYTVDLSACTEISRYNCPQQTPWRALSSSHLYEKADRLKTLFSLTHRTNQHSIQGTPMYYALRKCTVQIQRATLEMVLWQSTGSGSETCNLAALPFTNHVFPFLRESTMHSTADCWIPDGNRLHHDDTHSSSLLKITSVFVRMV